MSLRLKKGKNTCLVELLFVLSVIALFGFLIIVLLSFINEHDAAEIHYLIFIATVALVLIAYYEFNKSHNLTKNEFLLYLSNRWGDSNIIEARSIIHELFTVEYRINKLPFDKAINQISEKILSMSHTGGSIGKDFVILLNLLDFFETLGYFYARGDLDKNDIMNTCGNNIIFYYPPFKEFIRSRRKHHPKDFQNFDLLYANLK